MEFFQQIGAELEYAWRQQNYNETTFPALAAEVLRRAELPSKVSAWETIEWALKQAELPPQNDPHASFGDPPITLYVGPRFHIDIYFWINGTTEIHQHSFCGAFQVLLGSSLHSWYDFVPTERVNFFTEIGSLNLKSCELLKLGDVKEIFAGREYIHSLFHLDQPSATVVVRTNRSPLHRPQFAYHKPSLALDPFFYHETTTKHLQIVAALFNARHPETDRLIAELLGSSDFQTSFAILSTVREHLSENTFDQLFNLGQPAERFEKFLEIVRLRHGTKAKDLSEIFERRDRTLEIVRRRSYVTNPEHRFFFALLLNVEGRSTIFRLITERFPNADPVSKILDWTHDLAQTRVVGVNTPNALGMDDFGDVDLSILEHLLNGRSADESRSSLIEEYGAERLETIGVDEKLTRIRTSGAFRPLLEE